jgi:hyperosmotically inducible protein
VGAQQNSQTGQQSSQTGQQSSQTGQQSSQAGQQSRQAAQQSNQGQQNSQAAQQNSGNAGAASSSQGAHPVYPATATAEEDRITREVRHQLLMLPWLSVFDDLKFAVQGNTVVLLGEVVNPATKSDAESAVKHIEGVEKVENKIEVLPPSPMDDQIRRREYYAIYGSAPFFQYSQSAIPSIHIIVKNGRVKLEGVVDNQADKDLAYMKANGVPGVFGVTNNLVVINPRNQK